MKIFVSYSHVDKWQVSQITKILEGTGHQVWFDYELLPGQNWQNEILEKIDWCEIFLYALSPESVASDWCQWEFYEAITLDKSVLPVLLQANTKLPKPLENIQYADFTAGPTDEAVFKLLKGLHSTTLTSKAIDRPSSLNGIPAQAYVSPITLTTLHNLNEFATLPTDDDYVSSLIFSTDGRVLVSAGHKRLNVWKMPQGTRIYSLHQDTNSGLIAVSPNSKMIATGHKDGHVSLISISTGEILNTFQAHLVEISGIAFSPDGKYLVSTPIADAPKGDHCFKFWNISHNFELEHTELLWGDTYSELIFSPDGKSLVAIADGGPQLWTPDGKTLIRDFCEESQEKLIGCDYNFRGDCLAFSANGQSLAVGFNNWATRQGILLIWDTSDGKLVNQLHRSHYPVNSVVFAEDGFLVCGDSAGHLAFFSATNFKKIREVYAHNHSVAAMSLSPNGTLLATCSYDGNIKLWGVRNK